METSRASSNVVALELMRVSASVATKAWKLSFLETKSVSQLTSKRMPSQPHALKRVVMMPWLAARSALDAALAMPFSRRYLAASSRSPLHSIRAFLQSIMPAFVLSRNDLTIAAEISAIIICRE